MNSTASPKSPSNFGDVAFSPCSPTFYGVYLGYPDPDGESRKHVYEDKTEALKIARKCKKSRFKVFESFEEAENFALNGPDPICSPGAPVAAERPSPFKAPISQELVKFRKFIEKGDLDEVKWIVSNNPRYLVSCGDTPAILHEGARYNALHVAAKFDQPKICDYVLRSVTDPEFIQNLYGEDKVKDTVKQRCDILLDLYLNTPDKAFNDTPLHFASKIGALDVIKVLISYDKCDKSRKNKQGQTALEVVSSRRSDVSTEEKNEIIRLLSSEYYIAVLRPLDPVRPPVLEGPFLMTSPTKTCLSSLLDSEMHMSGVAGPMKYEEAINFKKMWKRPSGSPLTSPGSPCSRPAFSPSSFKKPDKIIERIGRELCSEMGVYWVEYWPFLNDFANFRKEKDISLLEKYFMQRFNLNSFENEPKGPPDDKLEDLYTEFNKLSISKKEVNLSYLQIDKTCLVYANKLVESLYSKDFQCFLSSLNRCQDLITSCVTDKRYSLIEFNRIHAKLAALVKQKISEYNASEISSYIHFLNSFIEMERSSLTPSVLCICQKILSAFHESTNGMPVFNFTGCGKYAHEESIKCSWLSLESCSCPSDMKVKTKKRLVFWSRFREKESADITTGKISSCLIDSNDNKMIADNSDSDEYFQTPPSSPGTYRCTDNSILSASDDDSSSESEMYSADEGTPITIEGNSLTDMDRAVYEALDESKVQPSKHPFICLWLQDCKLKFHYSFSTPLVFSPLSPVFKGKYESMKSLRDSLHHTPLSTK